MLLRHPHSSRVCTHAGLARQRRLHRAAWLTFSVVLAWGLLAPAAAPAQAQLRAVGPYDKAPGTVSGTLVSGLDASPALGVLLTPTLSAYGHMSRADLAADLPGAHAGLRWPASRLGAGLQWQLSSVSALRFELDSLRSGVTDRFGVALQLRL